jgi:hypothetical protein
MIEHGASIGFVQGLCTIRINENYPYKSIIERILDDMRTLILSQEYIFKHMISQ